MPARRVLPLKFYDRPTELVARELLGKRLVRMYRGRRISGIIVETEAYLGRNDSACHSWNGRRTERVKSMYLPGGHAYVYLIYGMYSCFNVVTRGEEEPEAVLVRALEPDEGISGVERTDGPGRLCRALKIDRRLDGALLDGDIIFIEQTGRKPAKEDIGASARIGVEYALSGGACEWPMRFTWRGNPHLSRKEKKWINPSPRTKLSGRFT